MRLGSAQPTLHHGCRIGRPRQVAGVAGPCDDDQAPIGEQVDHPTTEGGVFLVVFTGDYQGWDGQVRQLVPTRHLRAGTRPPQAVGESGCSVGETGVDLGLLGTKVGEELLSEPSLHECGNVIFGLDLGGQRLVTPSSIGCFDGILDAGSAADEDERGKPSWPREGERERHTTTQRIPKEIERFVIEQFEDPIGRLLEIGCDARRPAVSGEIDGHDGSMATQELAEGPPCGGRLRETMEKHQRGTVPPGSGDERRHVR